MFTNLLTKNKFLFILLSVFFIVLRLYPIWPNNFPFNYDNAKDSLVLLQTWVFNKPPLLGAVTSMEGLWQGPFWYYILFPFNLILGFQPIASVATVISLGVFTLWLFWKHLGKLEALFYAISPMVILTQQTAWSPYLPMFSTAWILVILASVKKNFSTIQIILLGFSVSLLFHSEIAFGIVFLISLFVFFVVQKIKLSLKQVLVGLAVIGITLIPQAIFEVRHDFIETRSVARFVTNVKSEGAEVGKNKTGIERINEVFGGLSENAAVSTIPLVVFLLLILVGFKKNKGVVKFIAPFILVPFVLYLFLPFKIYYLVGLAPFWIYLMAEILKTSWPKLVWVFAVLAAAIAIIEMISSKRNYEVLASTSRILFAPKLAAVNKAYEMTDGVPFRSYQYVPEVYDYVYQYIYQYTSLSEGRPVPVEYSYSPGETAYMQTLKIVNQDTKKPAYTILIVEKGENDTFFATWWNNQTRGKKIIDTQKINDSISVYKLTKK